MSLSQTFFSQEEIKDVIYCFLEQTGSHTEDEIKEFLNIARTFRLYEAMYHGILNGTFRLITDTDGQVKLSNDH